MRVDDYPPSPAPDFPSLTPLPPSLPVGLYCARHERTSPHVARVSGGKGGGGTALEQHKPNFLWGDLLAAPVEQVVLQVPISDAKLEGLRMGRRRVDGGHWWLGEGWESLCAGISSGTNKRSKKVAWLTTKKTPYLSTSPTVTH